MRNGRPTGRIAVSEPGEEEASGREADGGTEILAGADRVELDRGTSAVRVWAESKNAFASNQAKLIAVRFRPGTFVRR